MSNPDEAPILSNTSRLNLLTLSQPSTQQLVQDLNWPAYRAGQILRWLYRHRVQDIEHMTDLSQEERLRLRSMALITRMESFRISTSTDGTKKFLGRLEDGVRVESVLIPDGRRLTLCLSTQVGCTLDCRFCLTGTLGLKRNLKAHEIVDQVLTVQDHLMPGERLTNLVLMGMGEPLANFEAVSEALTRLTDSNWGLKIPARRITLSTAGLAPRLKEAAALGVNLAVSLNATTDALRDRLMPAVNRLWPLKTLLEACRNCTLRPRQHLTFEYVLLDQVNDSDLDARRLATLLAGIRCKVNLIPFNEFPGSSFRRPTEAAICQFQSLVRRAGIDAFVRKSKGPDVLGACGQLGEHSASPEPLIPILIGTSP